jgi:hypothetical protein
MTPLLAAVLFLAQADWKSFTLGPVKLDLPATPKLKKEAEESTWTVQADDGMVVSVSVSPVISLAPDRTLAMTVLGAADSRGGRIVDQKDLLLSGWPGIEATVQPKDLPAGRLRAYHLADRLIVVFAVGEGKAVDRLMDSISLNAFAGVGQLKIAGPVWKRIPLKPFAPSIELPGTPDLQVMRFPGMPNPGRRFGSGYGNREYGVVYVRFPAGTTEEDKNAAIEESNTSAIQSSGSKLVRRSKITMCGLPAERAEATALDRRFSVFFQTAIDGDLLVIQSAFVPTALKSSPELIHFLDSYRSAKPAKS